jgi:sugar phosphate isomerase/epimerase
MTALVSLSFGHYFLKEGNHALLGAETAQALPNSQVYYAFIRGACRQYGVPWFGNASCFNRWGYKNYEVEGSTPDAENQSACGADQGASVSLLKRLMYTHILYNSVCTGFEMGWIREVKEPDGPAVARRFELTPIGMVQQDATRFVEQHGAPGTLHTPVALLLDFYSGWTVPRHFYSGDVYQVWGGMPYEEGDYLTHGVLSLLYPGYEDSSYYHDERGFLSPTPYGDLADVVLSDIPTWALGQYGLVIAAGALTPGTELRDNLRHYLAQGGHLVLTAANARQVMPELRISEQPHVLAAPATVKWADGAEDHEMSDFELFAAQIPEGANILATCDNQPVVFQFQVGSGTCTVLLSPFGLNTRPTKIGPMENTVDKPLACPKGLLAHVRRTLDRVLNEQSLFNVGEGLGLITCRKGPGTFTVGIHNNGLQARPFKIESRCGTLREIREIPLGQREKGQPGYWPTGMSGHDGGPENNASIAGGDIRIFCVAVDKEQIQCLPEIQPAARPRNRFLALRGIDSLQDSILQRPTFFQHFDGVKLNWRYTWARDRNQIDRERGWIARQQLRVVVDFCGDLNFYPGLTLLNTLPNRFTESLDAIDESLGKAARLGAKDALMSLHRQPENHCSTERAEELFIEGLRAVCRLAENHGQTVHLQYQRNRWWGFRWWNGPFEGAADLTLAFLDKVQAPNLRLALDVGHATWNGESLSDVVKMAGDRLGMVLYSAPRRDLFGQVYDAHLPVSESGLDLSAVNGLSGLIQILDGIYSDPDAEYRDCRTVWSRTPTN